MTLSARSNSRSICAPHGYVSSASCLHANTSVSTPDMPSAILIWRTCSRQSRSYASPFHTTTGCDFFANVQKCSSELLRPHRLLQRSQLFFATNHVFLQVLFLNRSELYKNRPYSDKYRISLLSRAIDGYGKYRGFVHECGSAESLSGHLQPSCGSSRTAAVRRTSTFPQIKSNFPLEPFRPQCYTSNR